MSVVPGSDGSDWAATLFERAPIGQALVTPDGRWARVNPALAAMLGRDGADLVGQLVSDVVHPDDELPPTETHVVFELRFVRADETVVHARATSSSVADAPGQSRHVVLQVEDVTEARRHQAILERSSDLVVVLDREVRIRFVSPLVSRLLGRTVEEVLGSSALDHVHPDDREMAAADLLDTMTSPNIGVPTTLRLLNTDGEAIAFEALAANLLDDEAVQGVVVSLRDVRERDAHAATHSNLDLRYRALAVAAQDAIVTVDDAGRVWSWNAGARRTLGVAAEHAIGGSVAAFLPDGLPAPGEVGEIDAVHADGHLVPVEVTVSCYEHEGATYRLAILRDVSARRAAEAAARAADVRFRSAFDAAPIGIALVGVDGAFIDVNAALCSILGRRADDLVALRFQDITHPDDLEADLELLGRLVAGRIPGYRMEKRYLREDGDLVWAQLSVTLVRDENGEPAHFISQIEDITERKALDDDLAFQARHDDLTGLLNRHAMLRRFDQALARRHLTDVTALYVDVDGFKEVNDTYGHAVGDEVLRAVATRISATLRPADAAARIGGDEFVALLEGLTGRSAAAVAERLTAAIADPIPVSSGHWVQVRASVGFAAATPDDVTAAGLLARADAAMYEVKRRARAITLA